MTLEEGTTNPEINSADNLASKVLLDTADGVYKDTIRIEDMNKLWREVVTGEWSSEEGLNESLLTGILFPSELKISRGELEGTPRLPLEFAIEFQTLSMEERTKRLNEQEHREELVRTDS